MAYTEIKTIIRLLRRSLLAILFGYWLIFRCYTAERFVTGGSSAVVGWYKHISASPNALRDGWHFVPWSWGRFLAAQLAIFGATLALCLVERSQGRRGIRTIDPVPD